jgi:hypothetical protein
MTAKGGGTENEPNRVLVMLGARCPAVLTAQRGFSQAGLDALHDGRKTAEQVSRGHQVGQKVNPARLGDSVGIFRI